MAEIPYDIFRQAGHNWDQATGRTDTLPKNRQDLNDFLGCNFLKATWHNQDKDMVCVPDHAVEKFYMLAGPHYLTIVKAHIAKNDLTSS